MTDQAQDQLHDIKISKPGKYLLVLNKIKQNEGKILDLN